MKKVYLYKRFERFWHWGQTLLVSTLIFTGFEIHGTTQFMGYQQAVQVHDIAAWAFLVLIVFAVFWHLFDKLNSDINRVRKSIGLVGFNSKDNSLDINRKDLPISFLSTRATSAISFNVRGILYILQAA